MTRNLINIHVLYIHAQNTHDIYYSNISAKRLYQYNSIGRFWDNFPIIFLSRETYSPISKVISVFFNLFNFA